MGKYRAHDVLLVPSLISLTRIPLAALFPLCVDWPAAAIGVLAAAGISDIVDGWYARHYNQATPLGAVVDGVTDKIFVLSVIASLLAHGELALGELALLATRDLGELPLVIWWAFSHHQRRRRASTPKANVPGKVATVLQFATVAAITAGIEDVRVLVWLTAAVGAAAALIYWRRELGAQDHSGDGGIPRRAP